MKLAILNPQTRTEVAQVHLNGHAIEPGGPLGQAGAMRSFTILKGSVRDHWANQQPLVLQKDDGQQAPVRIAALPVEEGEMGFIEFL